MRKKNDNLNLTLFFKHTDIFYFLFLFVIIRPLVLRDVLGLLTVPGTELNPGVDAAPLTSVRMSR